MIIQEVVFRNIEFEEGLILIMTSSEDSDYVGEANTPINFFPGDFSGIQRCTNITINEDDILEYDEVFNVVLMENSSRLDIESGRDHIRVTIIEDDDCKSLCLLLSIKFPMQWWW